MLINLFHTVRSAGVPCTLRELLDLLGALEKNLAFADMEDFYFLSRTILVKDEKITISLIEPLKFILKASKP